MQQLLWKQEASHNGIVFPSVFGFIKQRAKNFVSFFKCGSSKKKIASFLLGNNPPLFWIGFRFRSNCFCFSVFLSFCPFVFLSFCLSVFAVNTFAVIVSLFQFIGILRVDLQHYNDTDNIVFSFCLFVFLSFCLSVCMSFCLSVFLSFCLSVFLSFCLSVFLSFSLFVSLSLQ